MIALVFMAFFMRFTLKQEEREPAKAAQEQEEQTEENTPMPNPTEQTVTITRQDGNTIELPLEEYLIGVVSSEMPANFSMEALKAQAVAARTFVAKRNFAVDDTTSSQVYQDESQLRMVWKENYDDYYEKIHQAVADTKGEILTYEGEIITAAFFSSCNGYTNNSEDYWANSTPYLRSVESPWDQEVIDIRQECVFDRVQLAEALGFEQAITSVSTPLRYDNNYVKSVTIDGIVFSGRELREALGLRSSAFEIAIEGDQITFITYGFGHGIGMSQYGAEGMARSGKDYQTILLHYYTGTEITML